MGGTSLGVARELQLPLVYVISGTSRGLPAARALSGPRHVALHANANFFASAPASDGEGAHFEGCFVLTQHHLPRHEGEIVEAVLGARRPSRFLLELTFLLAPGGAHLAEAFFAGRIVRQWYFMDALVNSMVEEQHVTMRFDTSTCDVHMNGVQVLHYDAKWAVAVGHTWAEACLPARPYFSTAFVLSSLADEVSLVALPTEIRTGRAVVEY